MKLHSVLVAVVAVVLWSGGAAPASAQATTVRGTTVTMTAPTGFRASRNVTGFENGAGSTITVAEYPPDSFAELAAVFASPKTAATRFAADGVRITRIEQLAVAVGTVLLAIGGQEKNGKELTKYITLFGGAQRNTVVITFNLLGSSLSRSDVETALRSVALERVATLDERVAKLPFAFVAVAPFRTKDVLSENTALLTSFDGTDPSGMKPLVIVARAATSATTAQSQQMAAQELRGMSGFRDAQIAEQSAVTFAGGQGYYMSAVADGKTMLQYLRVLPGGSYIRLVARGQTAAIEDARAAIKELADSVKVP